MDWFNTHRLLEPIGNMPPAEAEARYYAQLEPAAMAARLKLPSLRRNRRGSVAAGVAETERRPRPTLPLARERCCDVYCIGVLDPSFMTEGILLFQLLIVSTILVTRVVSKGHVLTICLAWTLFTFVAVFASGLMALQLVVIWGTYMLLRPKEDVGTGTLPKEVSKPDGGPPSRAPVSLAAQTASVAGTGAQTAQEVPAQQPSSIGRFLQEVDNGLSRRLAISEATKQLRADIAGERIVLQEALQRARMHLEQERRLRSLGEEGRRIYEEAHARISATLAQSEADKSLPAYPLPNFFEHGRYRSDAQWVEIEREVEQLRIQRDEFRSALLQELLKDDWLRDRFWAELASMEQPDIHAGLSLLFIEGSFKTERSRPSARLTLESIIGPSTTPKVSEEVRRRALAKLRSTPPEVLQELWRRASAEQILCLANSRKTGGRCIAGKKWAHGYVGGWVRPVSARPSHEVSEAERLYEGGGEPGVLDVVRVPLLDACPDGWQQENWRLNPGKRWEKVGRLEWSHLAVFCDPVAPLWHNGDSTYHGRNDEIPLERVKLLRSSLCLVHVRAIRLRVFRPGEAFGDPRPRLQGHFEYAGDAYALRVTDPVYEGRFHAKSEGYYDLGESYLTISIGEPYDKRQACYKLIAAIIPRNPSGTA